MRRGTDRMASPVMPRELNCPGDLMGGLSIISWQFVWRDAMAAEGLLDIISKSGFQETITRLKEGIASRGLTFLRSSTMRKALKKPDLSCGRQPSSFSGMRRAGHRSMQANQTIGIDLPLRALVWRMAKARPGFVTTILFGLLGGMLFSPRRRRWRRRCARVLKAS